MKLPDVYVCLNNEEVIKNLKKHGYENMEAFRYGLLDFSFITWEGKNNVTVKNITGKRGGICK